MARSRSVNPFYEEDFWEPNRRRKPRRRGGALKVIILLALTFIAASYLGARYQASGNGILDFLWGVKPPDMVLLLGVDSRNGEASRADTIMLLFPNAPEGKAALVSIPRDTRVAVVGHGETKVNHSYAYGGYELAVKTVSDFLGLSLTRYAEIDFKGFTRLVDAMGGIDLDVEKRMYYQPEGIDLYPGLQHLDGEAALDYVRYRGDAGADLARAGRQQRFLKAFGERVAGPATVWRLPELAQLFQETVNTNLTFGEILALAKELHGIKPGAVETAIIPGEPKYIGSVSYYVPDRAAALELVRGLAGEEVLAAGTNGEVGH